MNFPTITKEEVELVLDELGFQHVRFDNRIYARKETPTQVIELELQQTSVGWGHHLRGRGWSVQGFMGTPKNLRRLLEDHAPQLQSAAEVAHG